MTATKFLRLADGNFRRMCKEGPDEYSYYLRSGALEIARVSKSDASPTDEPLRIVLRVLGSRLAQLSPAREEALIVAGELAITAQELIEFAYETTRRNS